MATRRNKHKHRKGGNPLRRKLEECIKEIVVHLACTTRYNAVDNGDNMVHNSRLMTEFNRLKNIDAAISRCTTDMLENPVKQAQLADPHAPSRVHHILGWYGLFSFYSLLPQEQHVILEKIKRCTEPSNLTKILAAADASASARNAFTADVVNDLRGYL